jgi:uncharacterized membrane protein YgcG
MTKSTNPIESYLSKEADFVSRGQLLKAGEGSNPRKPRRSFAPEAIVIIGLLGTLCIGLSAFALFRSNNPPVDTGQASCQKLIDQAITFTGNYCDQIGTNKGCYGNTTIQAQMVANSSERFSKRGDMADVSQIQSISASPLNLTTEEWGIAIFRVLANLPGSVPGETAMLMVFGNTKLDKISNGLDSFYFSSELGQIVCDKVPFDGILVNMPDGVGWTFNVNGTELTLIGNASLKANKNGNMEVSLYKGAGQITSSGQTQYFGAGQKVSVNLGGPNGNQAISPPSQPKPLTSNELKVACTMTGSYCRADVISTVDAAQAQTIVQSVLTSASSNAAPPSPPLIIQTPVVFPLPPLIIQTPVIIPTGNSTLPTASLNTPLPGNGNSNVNSRGNGKGKGKRGGGGGDSGGGSSSGGSSSGGGGGGPAKCAVGC